ncbi:hemin ABC transporter substrate-binding protein [Microbacterium sp. NPDC077663]|uniref:hemin ABC transporter substrate-binding protein n=1 Tax=Microbacterium sp. NPDC077663 TaxID=3364189 RepID=UPI0037CA17BC
MRSRLSRAPIVLALTTALFAALTACQVQGGGDASGPSASPALADVQVLADPLGWEGPSTAVAAQSSIEPLTGAEPALPATVVDAQGTQVTVTDTSRILTLDIYGSLSRIVFELGLGDSVVARDTSTAFPEASNLPVVTENGHDLNAEAILDAAPSVILTDTSLGPWDTILQMRDAGIPVVVVESHRSLENIDDLTEQVAAALGVSDRGEELAARSTAAVEAKIAEIAEVAPTSPNERLRMMFLYARGQSGVYYLFGEESGADSLITALGGVDVAAEIGWQGMRPVTDEALVDANPDLLIMMTKGLESVGGVDGLSEHLPAVAQTDAGRNRRIVDMSDATVLSFGPASADVLDALAVAIYAPEAVG